ncbi:MAG: hypothetical protein JW844_01245 [Candidatus Omnitrophica bacterium]|nr:hypothetical protein [Candidatus Omnitrophota bacterium]
MLRESRGAERCTLGGSGYRKEEPFLNMTGVTGAPIRTLRTKEGYEKR